MAVREYTQSPSIRAILCVSAAFVFYQLVLVVIGSRRRNKIIRENRCKPIKTYPHKDPILGLDVVIESVRLNRTGGLLNAFNERYARLNTYTFSQNIMGKQTINTAEPENIKALLATQFKDFELPPRRKIAFASTFGHGIFTTDGPEWEKSRALLRPNFVRNQIGDLDTFEEHVTKLIARIPKDGSVVDLQPLFFMLTMDSATEFLFGRSTDVLLNGEASRRGEQFADAFTYIGEVIGFQSRVGKLATLIPNKRFDESVKLVHEYVAGFVQEAIDSSKADELGSKESERYVFSTELARTGVDKQKIQDELMNILLAGRDTTASLLSYTLHILARRQDVQEKLRSDISTLGTERPSFEQVKSLKYLQWVLNEVLRLHPIVPANGRCAVRDTTLPVGGGEDGTSPIFVKAGQPVLYHNYVIHRRKDLYGEDALDFKPERWEHLRPGWQYIPFNGGPRICIGQQFALTEASYTVIRLLQAFKSIEYRGENTPLLERLTLTSAVRGGVQVSLRSA